jgi:hypothetical protein
MKTNVFTFQVFLLLLCLSGSFACLDQIELRNQRFTDKATIIQGRLVLTATAATVNVSINQNGDFEGLEIGNFISGANVVLLNEQGKAISLQENTRNRNYTARISLGDPNFAVKIGGKYQLQVKLRDGKSFESTLETLLEVPKLEKINFQTQVQQFINFKGLVDRDTFMQYRLWSATRPQKNAPKVLVRREIHMIYKFTDNNTKICYCVEPQRVEKVFLYKASDFSAERLDSFLFFDNLWDHRFSEGCYIKFVQESLTPGSLEYWEQVKKLSERTGNMFDPPAGKIISNFGSKQASTNQVFGYFYATQQDTLSIFISPQAAGRPRRYCPIPPNMAGRPTPCDDCLLLSGSSTTKPKFWPQ